MTRHQTGFILCVSELDTTEDFIGVKCMNSNLLKAIIVKNGDTQEKLAEAMGLNTSALNMRINGKIEFRRNEINFIKQHYGLSSGEIDEIFFAELVSN